MTGAQFEAVLDWQRADLENRRVTIKVESKQDFSTLEYKVDISCWVYDQPLQTGQFVKDVSEIDLIGVKKQRLLEAMQELEKMEAGLEVKMA
jgi:hypothetical protein